MGKWPVHRSMELKLVSNPSHKETLGLDSGRMERDQVSHSRKVVPTGQAGQKGASSFSKLLWGCLPSIVSTQSWPPGIQDQVPMWELGLTSVT